MLPVELTCEYAVNPLGIDTSTPRFGWLLASADRGAMQSAYQVLVASSEEKLAADEGDLWDSGRAACGCSVAVEYGGAPLTSAQQCCWKVRVWDQTSEQSDWSAPATFEMGLLDQADWYGTWIGAAAGVPAPLLRKQFEVRGAVTRARLYVSGIGWSEVYLNGGKITDRVLDPAASEYPKSIYYVVHDVTGLLKEGDNAIGIWLGNGWYSEPEFPGQYGNCPRALAQLVVETEDGAVATLVSDDTWRAGGSCIILNDFWHGEIYDARLEMPGWSDVGFDDSAWSPAELKDAPGGVMRAQIMPPIEVMEVRKAVRLTEPKPNVYLYDFGQLFGGWIRVLVKGPAGTKITIKYSGRVHEESGLIDKRRHEAPKATDYYVLKGDPDGEVYEPRFTYHPVNYVQIEGAPNRLTIEDVDGCVVHTAEDLSGGFECSDDLVNKIHHNVLWTLKNALFGMPLDCLHREHWTGYLCRATAVTSLAAELLDKPDDVKKYAKLAEDVKAALNARWLDTDRHVYAGGSQTAQAFPLALGIVPETDTGRIRSRPGSGRSRSVRWSRTGSTRPVPPSGRCAASCRPRGSGPTAGWP